jgi:N-acetylglucosaminyl-diphospho-decaprenol L-rhamnosyltransferase
LTQSVDVVVPAFNHWELTAKCLSHLAAQTVEHHVILVDNGSSDETRQRLREDWPQHRVVELDHNHPFTQAVNLGVGAGDGELVVLMNNDVDLRPDCLQHLLAPLERDPSLGSAAAVLLQPGEQSIDSVGVTADVTLAGFARLQGLTPEHAGDAMPLLTGPEGTTAVYRRRAWEQVGGLDENIAAYMEILDLALKLRQAGWGTTVAPQAIGVHLGSATFGRRSPAQRRLAGFSRGYLLRRYDVLGGRHGTRALLTEALVVAVDALVSRDLAALRGRLSGWRAARGLPHHPHPPLEAIDTTISLRDSFALRRGAIVKPASD